jgi:TPR repeat protein
VRPTAPPPDPPAAASMYLGDMYRDGRGGLTKNEQEVARLYKLAADKGVADAQFRLGVFYEGSLGFAVYRIGLAWQVQWIHRPRGSTPRRCPDGRGVAAVYPICAPPPASG